MKFLIATLSVVLATTAYSVGGKDDLAKQLGADGAVEVEFSQGSAKLTSGSEKKIADLVNTMKGKGEIEEVKVLAWSDKQYPTTTSLPESDVKLAETRLDTVNSYLKVTLKVDDVDEYNMAEKPNKAQELLNTPAADIKDKAAETQAKNQNESLFAQKDKVSKALVMVYLR